LPDGCLSKKTRAGTPCDGRDEVDADIWFSDWERGGTLLEEVRHVPCTVITFVAAESKKHGMSLFCRTGMTDNRSLLKLTPEQREDLQRWAQSRTLPAGDVFRARLILALADGTTYREIARTLSNAPTAPHRGVYQVTPCSLEMKKLNRELRQLGENLQHRPPSSGPRLFNPATIPTPQLIPTKGLKCVTYLLDE
jgi:hypothetical protein